MIAIWYPLRWVCTQISDFGHHWLCGATNGQLAAAFWAMSVAGLAMTLGEGQQIKGLLILCGMTLALCLTVRRAVPVSGPSESQTFARLVYGLLFLIELVRLVLGRYDTAFLIPFDISMGLALLDQDEDRGEPALQRLLRRLLPVPTAGA